MVSRSKFINSAASLAELTRRTRIHFGTPRRDSQIRNRLLDTDTVATILNHIDNYPMLSDTDGARYCGVSRTAYRSYKKVYLENMK